VIYWNGKIRPPEAVNIAPGDRGFLLADGLFETMRGYRGRVFCLAQHWNRLKSSADFLEIPLPLSLAELTGIIDELLEKNHLLTQDASLRLTLTRGVGSRGLSPPADPIPSILLTAQPLSAASAPAVARICIVDIRRNELSPLACHKTLSYLENILARQAAVKAGADEAVLLNSRGLIAEASAANIFCVNDQGWLLTPRREDGALPGITRQVVLDLAKHLGIPAAEQSLTPSDLVQAQEIFLTNSLIEIQPASFLTDGKCMPITAQLQTVYRQRL
jgi:branched-chain amino acid aminotransferase